VKIIPLPKKPIEKKIIHYDKATFEDIFRVILRKTELSEDEVMERFEEKMESLGNLVNEKGAISIIAKELGIDIFDYFSNKRRY